MQARDVSEWMQAKLVKDGCIYQDDVVDYVVKEKADSLLRENVEGNLVLGKEILDAFRKDTEQTVVWIKPDKYWRFRVQEDEPGRDQRG